MHWTSKSLLGTLVVASSLGAPAAGDDTTGSGTRVLALIGGLIYTTPNEAPIRDGAILVRDGKIAAVGKRTSLRVPGGTEVIDCRGLTITAGLWNSHVHFLERKWADAATLPAAELDRQLEAMLTRYGFTTVFDTWSAWENTRRLRDRIESGEVPGPMILSTGEAMFAKSVTPSATTGAAWGALGFMPLESFQTARVADAAESRDAARKSLDAGVDGLKLYAVTVGRNGVALPEAAIEAAVKEAHSRGKPVFAHPTTVDGLRASVRAGVDVLAHTTPQSGPWDDAVLAAMKQSGVALVPTLKLWRYELRHERTSLGDRFTETATSQLRAWVGSGGKVLFGTDAGYMTDYDPREEYGLMADAGMSFRQVLAALTTSPAELFGASRPSGRIVPGLAADLTVLASDPSRDVGAFAVVRYTIRNGRIIYRAAR